MRTLILLLLVAVISLAPLPADAKGRGRGGGGGGTTTVRSYTKRDGTYVQSHRRTAPDGVKSNNWSTRGNVNPYTGKVGSK